MQAMNSSRCKYEPPVVKAVSMAALAPVLQTSLGGFLIDPPVPGTDIGEDEE